MAIRYVLEKQIDFLVGNDVADVVRGTKMAEREADHFVAHHGGSAAVAGIDGRVNLNAQAGNGIIVGFKLDAGNDALRD